MRVSCTEEDRRCRAKCRVVAEPLERRLLFASAGQLDPTFGKGGLVEIPFTNTFGTNVDDVAAQSDGKVVVDGISDSTGPNTFYAYISRRNTDGSLDTTFGNQGYVHAFDCLSDDVFQGKSIAIQKDGKILVVGAGVNFGKPHDCGIRLPRVCDAVK